MSEDEFTMSRGGKVFRRIITIALLATVLLAACGPTATPVPVEPTQVAVEPTEVAVEPTKAPVEPAPESFTLRWWSALGSGGTGVLQENPDYLARGIEEPGDLAEWFVERFHEEYPEYNHIDFEIILATFAGGQMGIELNTLIAAGEMPHILDGYGGRIGGYADIAINHDEYLDNEQKEDFIDYEGMFSGNAVSMIESSGNFQYYVFNADLVERACNQAVEVECSIPEPWSVISRDAFLAIGEAVKALDDGSYLTCLFGLNPSSQHMTWSYLASVGLAPFVQGEFQGFNKPEALDVLTLLKNLYDDGQIVPGASGLCDDDCFNLWYRGKVASFPARLGYLATVDKLVESGELDKAWRGVPVIGIQFDEEIPPQVGGARFTTAMMVTEATPEEYRKVAVDFAYFLANRPEWQGVVDILPAMHSQVERGYLKDGVRDEILAHIWEHGLADAGVPNPHYNELRSLWAEQTTAMFLGLKSPREVLFMFDQMGRDLFAE